MTPAEAILLTTLNIADEEIRKEIDSVIRAVVREEIQKYLFDLSVMNQPVMNTIHANRLTVENMALTAMKRFWRDSTPSVFT